MEEDIFMLEAKYNDLKKKIVKIENENDELRLNLENTIKECQTKFDNINNKYLITLRISSRYESKTIKAIMHGSPKINNYIRVEVLGYRGDLFISSRYIFYKHNNQWNSEFNINKIDNSNYLLNKMLLDYIESGIVKQSYKNSNWNLSDITTTKL